MEIKPCTEGKHSTTDLQPKIEKKKPVDVSSGTGSTEGVGPALPRTPISMPSREKPSASGTAEGTTAATPTVAPPAKPTGPPPDSDEDDPALEIPDGRMCRRRGCGVAYSKGTSRDGESCVHHPGAPIFHEGSKGYSCCKRRVLEFDQFMKITGCQTKPRHLFVGSGKKGKGAGGEAGKQNGGGDGSDEELLDTVRFDFYQSPTALTVSFFLKNIDKTQAAVAFSAQGIDLDLPTTDKPPATRKRLRQHVPLYSVIDPAKSRYTIMGTKLEVVLAKATVSSWPVLRSDDRPTGEILQVGRAGKVER